MCHVTKYLNIIGPHCTVWWDMACTHRPFPFYAEVGLACKTRGGRKRIEGKSSIYCRPWLTCGSVWEQHTVFIEL